MAGNDDDLEKLFMDDVQTAPSPELPNTAAPAGTADEPTLTGASPDPAAPAAAQGTGSLPPRQQTALDAAANRNGATGTGGMKYDPSTILESDLASLSRELSGIWRNITLVCNPFLKQGDVTAMLQHWDLWGPLIFNLMLACILSLEAKDKEMTFCVVFIVVIAGALLLTANVVLLGGSVSLLQSISLLGYCMFPLDIAAVFCLLVHNNIANIVVISGAVLWAMHASVPFVAGSVGDQRRWLAVYPMALMFVVLGWLIFISRGGA